MDYLTAKEVTKLCPFYGIQESVVVFGEVSNNCKNCKDGDLECRVYQHILEVKNKNNKPKSI